MLLKLLHGRPDLAERHAEELAELPLRSPALSLARDRLLAGTGAGDLLSGYRALSFASNDSAQLEREVASTLAQCFATHQIAPLDRQAPGPGTEQSLVETFERNRAEALRVMDRLGLTPVDPSDNRQA